MAKIQRSKQVCSLFQDNNHLRSTINKQFLYYSQLYDVLNSTCEKNVVYKSDYALNHLRTFGLVTRKQLDAGEAFNIITKATTLKSFAANGAANFLRIYHFSLFTETELLVEINMNVAQRLHEAILINIFKHIWQNTSDIWSIEQISTTERTTI